MDKIEEFTACANNISVLIRDLAADIIEEGRHNYYPLPETNPLNNAVGEIDCRINLLKESLPEIGGIFRRRQKPIERPQSDTASQE
jgi:hypothetical protein